MRKILLLIMSCVPFLGYSQFILTKDGMIDEKDPSKNYLIYNFEGKTANELYISALTVVTNIYASAKDVVSKVDGKIISINGAESRGICYGKFIGGCNRRFDLIYTMSIDFKDNRIRINTPIIANSKGDSFNNNNTYSLVGGGGMFGTYSTFNKEGKLKDESSKNSIEEFFNSLVNTIIKGIENQNKDDW
ncbi:hypothetical protein [Capnocytophaga gingivalis]